MSDGPDPDANEAAALLGPAVMKEYRDDCAAQLSALAASFAADAPPGAELLESVRLTAHRLSGSAGTYGYAEASRLAAALERRAIDAKGPGPSLDAAGIRLAIRGLRRALSLPE